MLFDFTDYIKKREPLIGTQKAVVVENNDPLFYGRIKVTIENVLEGEKEELPWVYPFYGAFLGGGEGSNVKAVPRIGTLVEVEFKDGCIYTPYYTGVVIGREEVNPALSSSETYGIIDDVGNSIVTNLLNNSMVIGHSSGSAIKFTDKGDVVIKSMSKVVYETDSETSITIDSEGNTFSVGFKDLYEVLANKYFIKVDNYSEITGNKEVKVDGSQDVFVNGTSREKVGALKSTSVFGDYDTSVTGTHNLNVSGEKKSFIARGENKTILTAGSETNILSGDKRIQLTMGMFDFLTRLGNIDLKTNLGEINVRTSVGNVNISAVAGNANVNGILVNLGRANEPVLLGLKTMQWSIKHNHGTPVGPSSVPLNAAEFILNLSSQVFTG